jgi:hypothetical protein
MMIMKMIADSHFLISGDVVEFDFQKKLFKFGPLASLLTPLEVHYTYICFIKPKHVIKKILVTSICMLNSFVCILALKVS